MLSSSNISVIETLRSFKSAGLKVGFLVPTQTGLNKSIMDATIIFRDFLDEVNIHNYEKQKKGTCYKLVVKTTLISKGCVVDTNTSLYRPETKNGDPRLWIYKLKSYSDPGDLLAIVADNNELRVVNCSKSDLIKILDPESFIYKKLFSNSFIKTSNVARELLLKLENIASLGYIKTLKPGDTGVGFTLESLLGISANNSTSPDYKGIEIKSSRNSFLSSNKGVQIQAASNQSKSSNKRMTILSKTPNWALSRLKGSKEILIERGKYNNSIKRRRLYHQLSVLNKNSYDMQLEVDFLDNFLHQIYLCNGKSIRDATWELELLKSRLFKKHKETFWVSAYTKGNNGQKNECFLYNSVKHTSEVDVNVLPTLLELGVITVDYTISESPSGTVGDHGYLFKIFSKNLDLLFKRSDFYPLI